MTVSGELHDVAIWIRDHADLEERYGEVGGKLAAKMRDIAIRMDKLGIELELVEKRRARLHRDDLITIDELGLSTRVRNTLKNDCIHTAGDLARTSEEELLRSVNFGRKSLNELKEALAKTGLKLPRSSHPGGDT